MSLTKEQLLEAVEAFKKCNGSESKAAEMLGLKRACFQGRIRAAKLAGMESDVENAKPQLTNIPPEVALKDKIRTLEAQIASFNRDVLNENYVKTKILKMAEKKASPPSWLSKPSASKSAPGVPTLFASDWHWGENVDPNQVNNVNSYNMKIAHKRAKKMIEVAIDLLNNHMVNPKYPGIVFALGGDMVSGDIHEELMATNDAEIMPVVIDLFGVLIWCISTLADHFGKVFVPCVGGNHGRNTHKIRNKGRNFTSFDWLTYQFLAKHFETDSRVSFHIPDGPDALYAIYNHKYLLTHGDQFRGGDGVIGALGPIIRGDHKKRSRNAQIDMEYDTMIIGHFHQLIQLERLIVNGSLKGYCEYAYSNNFGFEPPRQALWITHPYHGITFSMPVNVDVSFENSDKSEWVSWKG
jgi:hypothetical protein